MTNFAIFKTVVISTNESATRREKQQETALRRRFSQATALPAEHARMHVCR